MRRFLSLLVLLALLMLPALAPAQDIHPTIIDPIHPVLLRLSESYNPSREKLWCVTKWIVIEEGDQTRIRVTDIEEYPTPERASSAREIGLTGDECKRIDNGVTVYLPMIHSHPIAACQASPNDLITIVQRKAIFDGILCGNQFTVWYFAKDVLAATLWKWQQANNITEP